MASHVIKFEHEKVEVIVRFKEDLLFDEDKPLWQALIEKQFKALVICVAYLFGDLHQKLINASLNTEENRLDQVRTEIFEIERELDQTVRTVGLSATPLMSYREFLSEIALPHSNS